MATRCYPLTCKCEIDDLDLPTEEFIFRCLIHQTATVRDVIAHNQQFNISHYRIPGYTHEAWHRAKQKAEREEDLTPDEEAMFAKKQQMLDDMAAEKART